MGIHLTIAGAQNNRKREVLVFALLTAAILAMRLWHISELYAPFLFDDEMGYWSHAANLAGLSWKRTEAAWYSYGYSLLLVPLFWISHDMGVLYRLAIAENALLGVLGFWAGYRIICELDEEFSKMTAMFLSFVAASYSAYVFQSNIAWSETFVYTWFLVTVLLAVRFCKRPTYRNTALLTVATAFLYVIHNRTLAIVAALLLTLLYMWIRRRISWKHVVLAVGILAAACAANLAMKGYLTELMWGTKREFSGNNLASQSTKLKRLLSVSGVLNLFRSIAGKIWYLFTSTLLVGYLGFAQILKEFIAGVRESGRGKAMRLAGESDSAGRAETAGEAKTAAAAGLDSAYLFLGLSVLGTLALAAIAASPKTIAAGGTYDRLDSLFYGRYTDMVSGLLILLGLMNLCQSVRRQRPMRAVIAEIIPGLLVYGVCLVVIQRYFAGIGSYTINIPCVPGVYFPGDYNSNAISFKQITVKAAAVFVLVFLLFFLLRGRLRGGRPGHRCFLAGLVMVCMFWLTAEHGYELYTQDHQVGYHNSYSSGAELLAENTGYHIYCLDMSDYYILRQYLRAVAVEGSFSFNSTPDEDADNYFLVGDSSALEALDLTSKNYYYVLSVRKVHFLAVGDELAEDLESQGYECVLITDAAELE